MKPKIAALVLAAGSSSRMRKPKQLLRVGSRSLLRRSAEAATASDVTATVIVIGAEAQAMRKELEGLPLKILENARWTEGVGTSISAGINWLADQSEPVEGVVIMVCDQPHVSAATINRLIATHSVTGKSIVASGYSGTLGVPALFAREHFDHLKSLPPERGAKRLILSHRETVAVVKFEDGAVDLDRP
ncbi:MAG: NTP transferase domain-containing protein, partial [Chthoniobacterales bacterium]